jgi:hypothetical protein
VNEEFAQMPNDETPINGEAINAEPTAPTAPRSRLRGRTPALKGRKPALKGHAPEPVQAAAFAIQDRVIWPLQDRFALLGPGGDKRVFAGGALAVVAGAGVAAALLLSSGGSSTGTTTVEAVAAAPRQALVAPAAKTAATPEKQGPTLHGAAPVFKPAPEKTEKAKVGGSEEVEAAPVEDAAASSGAANPATGKISSQPGKVVAEDGAATLSRAATSFDGPPAGPAAVKVAEEFAAGFVVYETGGPKSSYKDAFGATAAPELTRSLLQRPPSQPAGVKVPKAKVVNVVAGPSSGPVYKVSVSLLRVGVTSELRLDMEKIEEEQPGKGVNEGKSKPEWRVTNVLG